VVQVDSEEIPVTAKEFDLPWGLARRPRQVFNRDQLLDLDVRLTEYIDPCTVTVHVDRLRGKIEADLSNPRHIWTVWGVGYKFEP
jgi:DNA-binding response OmpR family regulator